MSPRADLLTVEITTEEKGEPEGEEDPRISGEERPGEGGGGGTSAGDRYVNISPVQRVPESGDADYLQRE